MTYAEQSNKPVRRKDSHFEFEGFRIQRIYAIVPMIPASAILPCADSGVLATASRVGNIVSSSEL
jgi:hypothetical protein